MTVATLALRAVHRRIGIVKELLGLGSVGTDHEALDSRIIIEQAKGMIANENDISIDAAFARLRRYARSQRTPLRAVAAAVVESKLQVR